ncbi:ABC-2 family transporter protein [Candidatus Daviesbacteria bacterium]|nr:ABC-2 family transporter protein [Candidatus Daviesbacteria bacterium]
MEKYLIVLTTSWQNELIYRLNFILWRFRNILRFLMTYFLWFGIFVSTNQVFGYSQPQMFTYVFMVLVVSTLVLSAPSADNIGGEIANGDLSNYLVKPINYLKYWFARDLSSKALNLSFAIFEVGILWFILKPNFQILPSIGTFVFFLISLVLAILINYLVSVTARSVAFWTPESTWGISFVILVFVETLAGGIFPLDILPNWVSNILQFTPFPYLLYYPVAIFLGKITGFNLVRILLQAFAWFLVMLWVTKVVWHKGLKVYGSEGR